MASLFKPKMEDVAASLRGIRDLNASQRETVLRTWHSAGHIEGDATRLDNPAMYASAQRASGFKLRTPLQAAEESSLNGALLHNLRARLRRIGFEMKASELVDTFQLNECMNKAKMNTQDRISLKTDLAKLGLID